MLLQRTLSKLTVRFSTALIAICLIIASLVGLSRSVLAAPLLQADATLLPAPKLISPSNNAKFSTTSVVLRWLPLKKTLAVDEFYLITIDFYHQGHLWTDYAWTREVKWSTEAHKYLLDISDNGRFEWSVQLVSGSDASFEDVLESVPLSKSSTARTFTWQRYIVPQRSNPRPILTLVPTPTPYVPRPPATQAAAMGNVADRQFMATLLLLGVSMFAGVLILGPNLGKKDE